MRKLDQVVIAVPVTQPKGGQFVLHAKALHGNPFDGHTLGDYDISGNVK